MSKSFDSLEKKQIKMPYIKPEIVKINIPYVLAICWDPGEGCEDPMAFDEQS